MRENGTPMLADFRHSRVATETLSGWSTSSTVKSYRWMAPELFGDVNNEVTTASDVWAFGCLCMEASLEFLCFRHTTADWVTSKSVRS